MNAGALFVTGMQRSGTTLVERLLDAQDAVSVLSQPFPLLFTTVKGAFLGDGDRYPLGHLFLESRYEPEAFAAFLHGWRTTREELASLFSRMEGYSGQYFRLAADERRAALSGLAMATDFAGLLSGLNVALARRRAEWFGSRQTICEEYLPPLLAAGFRCLVVVRDPRDVIASLNHGRGADYGGAPKPTLLNVRNWRKSVAFALALEAHPGFAWCRYEDLVADTPGELARIGRRLAIGPLDAGRELRSIDGGPWTGNSSHGERRGVDASSVGIHRRLLAVEQSRVVEATCLPELQLLGYETSMRRQEAARVIAAFSEPWPEARPGTEREAATPLNASLEVERLERVTAAPDGGSRRWFLSAEAHARLREAFQP